MTSNHKNSFKLLALGLVVFGVLAGAKVVQQQIRLGAQARYVEVKNEVVGSVAGVAVGSVTGTSGDGEVPGLRESRDEGSLRVRLASSDLEEESNLVMIPYELVHGWNLVAFPVKSDGVKTAKDFIFEVALQGGYVTTVSTWDVDKWIEFSQRGEESFGHDYPLKPGRAYFVKSHRATSVQIVGEPLSESEKELALHEGWNAVALPESLGNAEQVLDILNGDDERATEVNRWLSGNWDPFVKRTYSAEDIQSYGNNFAIDGRAGYFVRAHGEVSAKAE